jgi:hypothetical protein
MKNEHAMIDLAHKYAHHALTHAKHCILLWLGRLQPLPGPVAHALRCVGTVQGPLLPLLSGE